MNSGSKKCQLKKNVTRNIKTEHIQITHSMTRSLHYYSTQEHSTSQPKKPRKVPGPPKVTNKSQKKKRPSGESGIRQSKKPRKVPGPSKEMSELQKRAEELRNAAREGNLPRIKSLINAGDDLEAKDDMGKTALMYAAEYGHDLCVKVLLKDTPPNMLDKSKRTALHWACVNAHSKCVKILSDDKGVDINRKDSDGRTPLHLAANSGCEESVKLLREVGAKKNIKDNDGQLPYDLAPTEQIKRLL